MSASVANIRLGQCTVTYNGQDLGFTKGGCEVSIKNDTTEIGVDEFGSTSVRSFHRGTRIEVKATFAEYAIDTLLKIINGAQLVEGAGDPEVDAVTVGGKGGVDLVGYPLVLHPTLDGVSDDNDITIFKAVVIGQSKLPYKVDAEMTFEVTWLAILDEGKGDGDYLAEFGHT